MPRGADLFNTGASLERLAQFYALRENLGAIREYRQLYGVAQHA